VHDSFVGLDLLVLQKVGTAVNATVKKREYCIPFISVIGVTWHHRKSAPEFQKMCFISNWHKREFWWLGHISSHYNESSP
jgi:hypothetical protein